MEPIPETSAAFDDLDVGAADDDLLDSLIAAAGRVREITPACVGLSYTLFEQGITFTLVASTEEIAALDAVQYLDGGPCVRAVERGTPVALPTGDPMDEEGWQLFARTTARAGIQSTLSLPVLEEGLVTAGFNLYGASPGCFDGHHEDIAALLGAWAHGASTNTDLSFETLLAAREAPHVVEDLTTVQTAAGLLAGRMHLTLEEAEHRLSEASRRAGVAPAVVGHLLLVTLRTER